MNVPMLDLKSQFAGIRDEIRIAIDDVLETQQFILGPQVRKLEESLAAYCRCGHAIGVSSGSDALLVALMALDIQPGDEVVTTPFTFFATAGAVSRLGARPVFADIDPATFNLDVADAAARIGERTRVILPVHLYGQCADMSSILAAARPRGIAVIEDAAQSIGAEDGEGRRAGAIGDLGCFSFFPTKNLGAFGDAGLVTTNSAQLADRVAILRAHGSRPKYHHHVIGGNFRIDTLQAAILQVKLNYLDTWNLVRQRKAEDYVRLFHEAGLVVSDGATRVSLDAPVAVPKRQASGKHIYHQFTVRALRRDALQRFLGAHGIETIIYYPVPLHLQECFANLGYRRGDLPEAERAADEVLSIPIYPELTAGQQEYVVGRIVEFYAQSQTSSPARAAE